MSYKIFASFSLHQESPSVARIEKYSTGLWMCECAWALYMDLWIYTNGQYTQDAKITISTEFTKLEIEIMDVTVFY